MFNHKSDEKIIDKENVFKYYYSKKDNYKHDFLIKTPAKDKLKFRELNKSKWIDKKNFDIFSSGRDIILKLDS